LNKQIGLPGRISGSPSSNVQSEFMVRKTGNHGSLGYEPKNARPAASNLFELIVGEDTTNGARF
jgi:hypothetical protein